MTNRSKSSNRWLKAHFKDPFVKKAHAQGLRSRAVFKLSELDQKYHLFKPGLIVLDLGAAPGGWSAYAQEKVTLSGQVYALDLLAIPPIPGVVTMQGDFLDPEIYQALLSVLAGKLVDRVISDLAPNTSGVLVVDQARAMYLSECVFEFCQRVLKPGGHFLIKVFQGEGFDIFLKQLKLAFTKTIVCKPEASRSQSREYYILGLNFKCATG